MDRHLINLIFTLILFALAIPATFAEETPPASHDTSHEKLMVLAPFIGTWKADVGENTIDISNYQWILGGKALRIMHSINDGQYGGEALIHWNSDKEAITYRYVTTSTFYTDGTLSPIENGFEAHEIVHGNMGGITETRAGYTMQDGEIHVWSQLLKEGEWTEKDHAVYVRAEDAEIRF